MQGTIFPLDEEARAGGATHSAFTPHNFSSHFSFNLSFFMFSRLSQVARHYSRPLPNYTHNSAASIANRAMASSNADDRNRRTIHTAACLIIGDEVLGGKVCVLEVTVGEMS